MTLDEIGLIEGTDKSSLNHDYLRHYEAAVAHMKSSPINVLELGVQGGQSLRMWRRFFPNATIVGLDMNPWCERHADDRIKIFIGSQDDPSLLDRICSEYPPTLVIDDASHLGGHTIASLEILFARLAPGGVYIIEDLFFHYGPEAESWRGYAKEPVATYFDRMSWRTLATRRLTPPSWWDQPFLDGVDWFSTVNSAIILRKKRDGAVDFAAAARLLEQHNGSARAWEVLCESIQRQHGPLDLAEYAIRCSISMMPNIDRFHRRLSMVLQSRGDIRGALAAQETAHRFAPGPENTERLTRLRQMPNASPILGSLRGDANGRSEGTV